MLEENDNGVEADVNNKCSVQTASTIGIRAWATKVLKNPKYDGSDETQSRDLD